MKSPIRKPVEEIQDILTPMDGDSADVVSCVVSRQIKKLTKGLNAVGVEMRRRAKKVKGSYIADRDFLKENDFDRFHDWLRKQLESLL